MLPSSSARSKRPTPGSLPSLKKTGASCAYSSPRATPRARSKSAPRTATARFGLASPSGGRAATAAANIRRAGLAEIVTVVPGDGFKEIPKLRDTFDFVFLDAWKTDYKRFFDLVFPRLTPRGLFLAHNVVNKQGEMRDFPDTIEHHPALFTSIVRPGSEGMSVSVKLR